MLTTVDLDDALLSRAKALCGLEEHDALLQEALNALIQRESARRLERLAGSEPQLQEIARRKGETRRS
jgi:Arc/MetJ family transcription regulator